jgi:hypothetical protein
MPALETHARFLLRGSALLVGLLVLWWFVLAGPMLCLLKEAAESFVDIQENAAGGWTVSVPLEASLPAAPGRPTPQNIRSVDFDIPRTDVNGFTFSIPVFWAVVLAAGGRRSLRPLMLGTALMCAYELGSLLVFFRITARSAVAQIAGGQDASVKWIGAFGHYLVVNALPFIVPLVVALSLHRELRAAILPWGNALEPAVPSLRPNKRKVRRRTALPRSL